MCVSTISLNRDLIVRLGPGSFIEVRKILPLLTAVEEGKPSFDVVAMSIPGYGFSEAPKKKGFDITKYAELGHKLMVALGYDQYGKDFKAGSVYRCFAYCFSSDSRR